MDAVRMRCNHKGWPIGPLALRKILEELERWRKSNKKFRVIIDYDPEWSMIVNIRPSTYDESVMLDAARPDEAIMKNLKRCEEQRRQENSRRTAAMTMKEDENNDKDGRTGEGIPRRHQNGNAG